MLSQILKLISFLFNLFWLLFGSVPASWIFCPQRQYRGDRQLFWQEEERLYDQAVSTCEDLWSCDNWDQCDSFDFSMIIVIFMIGMIIQDCDYFHNWGDLYDCGYFYVDHLRWFWRSSTYQAGTRWGWMHRPRCAACPRRRWRAAAWSTLLIIMIVLIEKVQQPDRQYWS